MFRYMPLMAIDGDVMFPPAVGGNCAVKLFYIAQPANLSRRDSQFRRVCPAPDKGSPASLGPRARPGRTLTRLRRQTRQGGYGSARLWTLPGSVPRGRGGPPGPRYSGRGTYRGGKSRRGQLVGAGRDRPARPLCCRNGSRRPNGSQCRTKSPPPPRSRGGTYAASRSPASVDLPAPQSVARARTKCLPNRQE